MYKRRARILFLGQMRGLLELSCGLVDQLASECLEARGVTLQALDSRAEELDWADLLIALDRAACGSMQQGQTRVPYRCWNLPAESTAVNEFIKQELLSMAAGMRMLQRQKE